MCEKKVRCGVVGVGGMGEGHCESIKKLSNVELTAICDEDPQKCISLSEKFGVTSFMEYAGLINSGLVDLVVISTPHFQHAEIAIAAFKKGLNVLCEKPLAVTVSEADRIIEAAKKSSGKFGIMYQWRTEPNFAAAKKLIDEGRLGELYRTNLITSWFRSQAYYNSSPWRATWKGEGGGVLLNQAPHLIDLFCWLAGMPKKLFGQTRTRNHNIEVEDEAFAFLEYDNGAHGYLYASTNEIPSQTVLELCGDLGKLRLTETTIEFWENESSLKKWSNDTNEIWAAVPCKKVDVALKPTPEGDPTLHSAVIHNMAEHILTGEPLIAPGEDGLNALEIINGIILSNSRNAWVNLPVDREEYDSLLSQLQNLSR